MVADGIQRHSSISLHDKQNYLTKPPKYITKYPRVLEVFFDSPEFFEAIRKFLNDKEVRTLGRINKAARDVCFSVDVDTNIRRVKMREIDVYNERSLKKIMKNMEKIDWSFVERFAFVVGDNGRRASMSDVLAIMEKCCPYVLAVDATFDYDSMNITVHDDTGEKAATAWFQSFFGVLKTQKRLREFRFQDFARYENKILVLDLCPERCRVISDFLLHAFENSESISFQNMNFNLSDEQAFSEFLSPVVKTCKTLELKNITKLPEKSVPNNLCYGFY